MIETAKYQYAYLLGALLLGIPWFIFMILREDLRKEMLVMSLMSSILAVTEIFYFGNYWRPVHIYKIFGLNLGIEDFIICFFYGGVASVVYQFFRNLHYKYILKKEPEKIRRKILIISFLIAITVLILLELFTTWNFTITSGICQLVFGTLLIYHRKDLFVPSIMNGILLAIILALIAFIVEKVNPGAINYIWQRNLSFFHFDIFGYPLDDLLWHFTLGFGIGSMYEVYYSVKDVIDISVKNTES